MGKFIEYLKLVFLRTFWGADLISKTQSAFGIFILIGFQFTSLPWEYRIGLLLVLIFIGTFKVWNEQIEQTEATAKQLAVIKDKTPNFEIVVGEVKKFTIKEIIAKYKLQLEKEKEKLKPIETKDIPPDHPAYSAFMAINSARSSFASAMTHLPGMPREETAEEEIKRLSKYISKLKQYEEVLSEVYKIELSIIGSRSDSNIEVWVESSQVRRMIVKDDFVENNIPKMPTSTPSWWGPPALSSIARVDKLYIASEGGDRQSFSKIKNLNADRPMLVFGDDYYVISNSKSLTLDVTIASPKRNDRQKMTVVVQLSNAPIKSLVEKSYSYRGDDED